MPRLQLYIYYFVLKIIADFAKPRISDKEHKLDVTECAMNLSKVRLIVWQNQSGNLHLVTAEFAMIQLPEQKNMFT